MALEDLPYYAQTAEFSCGPACAVMVLNRFDPGLGLSRKLEFDLWREMNLIGVRGADPWGLAVPFLRRGHDATVITEREETFTVDRWDELFEPEEIELARWAMEDNRRRAKEAGVEAEIRPPRFGDLRKALDAERAPVCMVNMRMLHGEDIPHWVVPTRIDDDGVTFHDPYPPKGQADVRFSQEEFWSIVEDVADPPIRGARSVVVVG